MKNQIFLMAIFCLISNITCSMELIKLDEKSEGNLLVYALSQAINEKYWPVGAKITLESFRCVKRADSATGRESEYEAIFCGRYSEIGLLNGNLGLLGICRKRGAYISATTLKSIGVTVSE